MDEDDYAFEEDFDLSDSDHKARLMQKFTGKKTELLLAIPPPRRTRAKFGSRPPDPPRMACLIASSIPQILDPAGAFVYSEFFCLLFEEDNLNFPKFTLSREGWCISSSV